MAKMPWSHEGAILVKSTRLKTISLCLDGLGWVGIFHFQCPYEKINSRTRHGFE